MKKLTKIVSLASSSATMSPATADHTLPVDEKTAGNVIAAKTACCETVSR